MKRIPWILLTFFLFISGCAPWTQVGGLYKSESHSYSMELPQGWMKSNVGNDLLITRDGILLQNIQVVRWDVGKSLEHTKKKLSKGMFPQEVAEVILDDIASNQGITDFQIIENNPAEVGGLSGFKAVCTYKNKDGLKFKSTICGFITGEWFYGIRFIAASRFYYDKDIKTFEKVLETFKLVKRV
jgi:hypothetical protein